MTPCVFKGRMRATPTHLCLPRSSAAGAPIDTDITVTHLSINRIGQHNGVGNPGHGNVQQHEGYQYTGRVRCGVQRAKIKGHPTVNAGYGLAIGFYEPEFTSGVTVFANDAVHGSTTAQQQCANAQCNRDAYSHSAALINVQPRYHRAINSPTPAHRQVTWEKSEMVKTQHFTKLAPFCAFMSYAPQILADHENSHPPHLIAPRPVRLERHRAGR